MTGMDLIQTPMYYSRTINNPLFATKINGKAGKFSYLALAAYDRNTAITVPGEEESNTIETTSGSYAGVGRIRYDFGNENFIGTLFLSRNFKNAYNYLNGLDDNTEYYKGHIFRNITSFQFTKQLFLRNIVQYNTFSKTFSVYPLLNYKFNAFTMFCIGMTQDYLNYQQPDYKFRTSGYQYFMKLQYLFAP